MNVSNVSKRGRQKIQEIENKSEPRKSTGSSKHRGRDIDMACCAKGRTPESGGDGCVVAGTHTVLIAVFVVVGRAETKSGS